MAASLVIGVGANATGVYSEIVRQARRAEEVIKRTPLRLEARNFGAIRGFTADIDRFDKSLTRMSAVIQTFGQSAAILFGVQRAMAGLVTSTIDVEKRMVGLQAVMGGTNETIQKFGDGLFDVAKQTGQSFAIVTDAAQEFARQGLGVEETLKRTRDALILTRTTGLDVASSVQDLTATLNTFKKEALDSTKVINTFRNVDTAFAVSAADLAEGIKRAGASAQDAKVSFNELNALITSLQQNTARGGSVIGNSLKSIFTRVQRTDTLDALEGIGVAVKDSVGGIRPVVQILTDLANKVQFLSDTQKAQVKETVAGTYQINALSALLQDLSSGYSVYNQALETANQTTNEAIKSNEQLNQSTSAMLNETLQNLTQFAAKVGEVSLQPFIKNALNSLNGLFDNMSNLGEDSLGSKLGRGLLQGLANFINGPGVALIGAALFKISRLVFEGSAAQLRSVLTLSRENSNILENQRRVAAVLNSQDPAIQRIIAGSKTRLELERNIALEINKQTEALFFRERLAGSVAASLTRRGVRTAAGGFIPEMVAEKGQVNRGVGGAPKSARPVVVPNFNMGRGKRETIVANNSEYIVPNFAGSSGSAIFNQDMVKQYGLPKGAKKIMAGGFVPNFGLSPMLQAQYLVERNKVTTKEAYKYFADRGYRRSNLLRDSLFSPRGISDTEYFKNRYEKLKLKSLPSRVNTMSIEQLYNEARVLPHNSEKLSILRNTTGLRRMVVDFAQAGYFYPSGDSTRFSDLKKADITTVRKIAGKESFKTNFLSQFPDIRDLRAKRFSAKPKPFTRLKDVRLHPLDDAFRNFRDFNSIKSSIENAYFEERGQKDVLLRLAKLNTRFNPEILGLARNPNLSKKETLGLLRNLRNDNLSAGMGFGKRSSERFESIKYLIGNLEEFKRRRRERFLTTKAKQVFPEERKNLADKIRGLRNNPATNFPSSFSLRTPAQDIQNSLSGDLSRFSPTRQNRDRQLLKELNSFSDRTDTRGVRAASRRFADLAFNSGSSNFGYNLAPESLATQMKIFPFGDVRSAFPEARPLPESLARIYQQITTRAPISSSGFDSFGGGLELFGKARLHNPEQFVEKGFSGIYSLKNFLFPSLRRGLQGDKEFLKKVGTNDNLKERLLSQKGSNRASYEALDSTTISQNAQGLHGNFGKALFVGSVPMITGKTFDRFGGRLPEVLPNLLKSRGALGFSTRGILGSADSYETEREASVAASKKYDAAQYRRFARRRGIFAGGFVPNFYNPAVFPELRHGPLIQKLAQRVGSEEMAKRLVSRLTPASPLLKHTAVNARDEGIVFYPRQALDQVSPFLNYALGAGQGFKIKGRRNIDASLVANSRKQQETLLDYSTVGQLSLIKGSKGLERLAGASSVAVRGALIRRMTPELRAQEEAVYGKMYNARYDQRNEIVNLIQRQLSGKDRALVEHIMFEGVGGLNRQGITGYGKRINLGLGLGDPDSPVSKFNLQRNPQNRSIYGNRVDLTAIGMSSSTPPELRTRVQGLLGELQKGGLRFSSEGLNYNLNPLRKISIDDAAKIVNNAGNIMRRGNYPVDNELQSLFNPSLFNRFGFKAGGYIPNMATRIIAKTPKQKEFINSLRPFAKNIDDGLYLSSLVGGNVNKIRATTSAKYVFGPKMKGRGITAAFGPLTQDVFLNQRGAKGARGANALLHEIGHAAFQGLGRGAQNSPVSAKIFDNLRRAYDSSRKAGFTKGKSFGLNLKSYSKRDYFEENAVQAFAENMLRNRSFGSNPRKNALYRYVRSLIGKGISKGFVPSFARPLRPSEIFGRKLGKQVNKIPENDVYQKLEEGAALKRKIPQGLLVSDFVKKFAKRKGINLKTYTGDTVANATFPFEVGKKNFVSNFDLFKGDRGLVTDVSFYPQHGTFDRTGMGKPFQTFRKVARSMSNMSSVLKLAARRGEITNPTFTFQGADENLHKFYSKVLGVDPSISSLKFGVNDITPKLSRFLASGHIPNFASPLTESITREVSALRQLGFDESTAKASVKVGANPRLASRDNPTGLGVYNTLQGQHSLNRALLDHNGENLKRSGSVPNFAPSPAVGVNAKFFGPQRLATDLGTQINSFKNIRFASLKSLEKYIRNLSLSVQEIDRNRSRFANAGDLVKDYNKRIAASVREIERRSFAGNARATLIKSAARENYQAALAVKRRPIQEANLQRVERDQQADDKKQARRAQLNQRLFQTSFALSFLGAGLGETFGGTNDRKKGILNSLGTDLALAATIPLLANGNPVGIGAGLLYGGYKAIRARQNYQTEEKFRIDDKTKSLELFRNRSGADAQGFQQFQQAFAQLSDAKVEGNAKAIVSLTNLISNLPANFLNPKLADAARKALLPTDSVEKVQETLGLTFQAEQDAVNRDASRRQAEIDIFKNAESRRNILGFKGVDFGGRDQLDDLARTIVGGVDIKGLSAEQRKTISQGVLNPTSTENILGQIGLPDLTNTLKELGGVTANWDKTLSLTIASLIDGKIRGEEYAKTVRLQAETQASAVQNLKSLGAVFSNLQRLQNNRRNFDFDKSTSLAQEKLQLETSPTLRLLGGATLERAQIDQTTQNAVADLFSKSGDFILGKLSQKIGERGGQKITAQDFIQSQVGKGNFAGIIKAIDDLDLGEEGQRQQAELKSGLSEIAEKNQQQIELLRELTKIRLEANAVNTGRNVVSALQDETINNNFKKALAESFAGPQNIDVEEARKNAAGFRRNQLVLEATTRRPISVDASSRFGGYGIRQIIPNRFGQTTRGSVINPNDVGPPGVLATHGPGGSFTSFALRNRTVSFGFPGEETAVARETALRRQKAARDLSLFQARKELGLQENFDANFIASISDPAEREKAQAEVRARAKKQREALTPALAERVKATFEQAGLDTVDSFSRSINRSQFSFGQSKDVFGQIRKSIETGNIDEVPKLIEEIRSSIRARINTGGGGRTEQIQNQANLERLANFESTLNEISLKFLGTDQSQINRIAESQAAELVGGVDNPQLTKLTELANIATSQLKELEKLNKLSTPDAAIQELTQKIKESSRRQELASESLTKERELTTIQEQLKQLKENRDTLAVEKNNYERLLTNSQIFDSPQFVIDDMSGYGPEKNLRRGLIESSFNQDWGYGLRSRDSLTAQAKAFEPRVNDFLEKLKPTSPFSGETLLQEFPDIAEKIKSYPNILNLVRAKRPVGFEESAVSDEAIGNLEQRYNEARNAGLLSFGKLRLNYAQSGSSGVPGQISQLVNDVEKKELIKSVNSQASALANGEVTVNTKELEALLNKLNLKIEENIAAKVDVNLNTEKDQEAIALVIQTAIKTALEDYHRKNNKVPQVK